MKTEREALELALDALCIQSDWRWNKHQAIKINEAIKTVREALAQPQRTTLAFEGIKFVTRCRDEPAPDENLTEITWGLEAARRIKEKK